MLSAVSGGESHDTTPLPGPILRGSSKLLRLVILIKDSPDLKVKTH